MDVEFEMLRPGILAELFDAVAAGLARLDSVETPELPRMADFAKFGIATEEALGGEPGSFMAAITASEAEAVGTALEASSFVPVLLKFAKDYPEGEADPWVGTAKELFEELNAIASDEIKRARDWPKSPSVLGKQINGLTAELLEIGVHVERPPGSRREGRKIKIFFRESPRDPSPPSPPSPGASNPQGNAENYGDSGGDSSGHSSPPSRHHASKGGDGDSNGGHGDGSSSGAVPGESRIGKPKAGGGDGGDSGDGTLDHPEEKEDGRLTADEVQRVRELVHQGMSPKIARQEVLGKRERSSEW